MKKVCLCLIFGGLFNSLFSEESLPTKLYSPQVTIQVVPYIYGDIFQPGYGISIRTQVSGHAFELAPIVIPPSRGYFGSSRRRIGLTSSYYYVFLRDKFFQPYLGCTYTHRRDLYRIIVLHYDGGNEEPYKITKSRIDKENAISSLIGIQCCSTKDSKSKGFSGYFFVDVQGLVGFSEYSLRANFFSLPRIGVGFQF